MDYINKPVNRAAFQTLLANAREVIEKKSGVRKILRSNAYEKVLETGENEGGRGPEGMDPILPEGLSQCVLVVNGTGQADGEEAVKRTGEIRKSCEAWMKEEALREYIIYEKEGLVVFILAGEDTEGEGMEKICRSIRRTALGRGYEAVIGIGSRVKSLRGIPSSYRKARAAMYEAQCSGRECCSFETLSYAYESPGKYYAVEVSQVVGAFQLGDFERAVQKARGLAESYRKTLPPYVVYAFVKKCVREVLECLDGSAHPDLAGEKQRVLSALTTAPNPDCLLERFEKIIGNMGQRYSRMGKREQYGGTMDEVINYIRLHYTEELSVKRICEVFYFNPSYFSVLFKTKTGLNYNDYVTDLRIRKAKELLRSRQYRINEIADLVGYHSSRYFSKVFKSRTGELPQEYKNRCRKADL